MMGMTVVLLVMAYGFRKTGRINRLEGAGLLLAFCAYNLWLVSSVIA
jgi:cation:H+ antiporter